MQTIGLVGGMSWESSAVYYRRLNERVRERLGGLHSAECVLLSVDFHRIERLQAEGRWDEAGAVLADAGERLARAGADFGVLCTNTMHLVADRITALPLLHIGDVTADAAVQQGLRSVALLGTRYTMEKGFYRDRLEARGLRVVTPDEGGRALVNRVIYDELCVGRLLPESRRAVAEVALGLGADGVILGCTELPLLLGDADLPVPRLDTLELHVEAAVDRALA